MDFKITFELFRTLMHGKVAFNFGQLTEVFRHDGMFWFFQSHVFPFFRFWKCLFHLADQFRSFWINMLLWNVLSKPLLVLQCLRKCPQASVARSLSDVPVAASSQARTDAQRQTEAAFFKHFPAFLTENSLRKHLPPDLWFEYTRALEELEELDEIVQQSPKECDAPSAEDTDSFFELARSEMASLTERLFRLQEAMLAQVLPDDGDVNSSWLRLDLFYLRYTARRPLPT